MKLFIQKESDQVIVRARAENAGMIGDLVECIRPGDDMNDFDQVLRAYMEKFGSPPLIGLDDEQIRDLYHEMKKAIAGECGAISEERYYDEIDPDVYI